MANKGGTEHVKVIFRDENGNSVTPDSSWWTLYRESYNAQTGQNNGYIVNENYQVNLPSDNYYTDDEGVTQADVTLQGADLPEGTLLFTAKALIDTSKGTGLPVILQKTITVKNIKYV